MTCEKSQELLLRGQVQEIILQGNTIYEHQFFDGAAMVRKLDGEESLE